MISRGIAAKSEIHNEHAKWEEWEDIWLHQHKQHTVIFNSCFIHASNTNCYKTENKPCIYGRIA
jgi:hypothetical protein